MYPRSPCISDPTLVWTILVASLAIAFAYAWIPLSLLRITARRRASVPGQRLARLMAERRLPRIVLALLLGAAAFVAPCGLTHLLVALNFFRPSYQLEAGALVATALLSIAFAVVLHRHISTIEKHLEEHDRLKARLLELENAHG